MCVSDVDSWGMEVDEIIIFFGELSMTDTLYQTLADPDVSKLYQSVELNQRRHTGRLSCLTLL